MFIEHKTQTRKLGMSDNIVTTNRVETWLPAFLQRFPENANHMGKENSIFSRKFAIGIKISAWFVLTLLLPDTTFLPAPLATIPRYGVQLTHFCWCDKHKIPTILSPENVQMKCCPTTDMLNKYIFIVCRWIGLSLLFNKFNKEFNAFLPSFKSSIIECV